MSTDYKIAPLQADDVAELSRFLTEGFRLPAGVACLSPEVLRWKYLPPASALAPARQVAMPASLIARAAGRIVGHVGLCPRSFRLCGDSSREVPTTHPIDWLASPNYPSVGLRLLLRGFGSTPTQYSIGGTPVAQTMLQALGFECRCSLSTYFKILRPLHRRLASDQGPVPKYLGAARDLLRTWSNREPRPQRRLELSRVKAFGEEGLEVLSRCPRPLMFSTRTPDLLNAYLGYPGGGISGWTVQEDRRGVGLALLSLVQEGSLRRGRLVECFLEGTDESLWQAAVAALTGELRQQAADDVTCFASTPWMEQALRHNGYTRTGSTAFLVRDRTNLLPQLVPCHLTQLEADHAYLQ